MMVGIPEKCPLTSIKIIDNKKMHFQVKRSGTNGMCQENDRNKILVRPAFPLSICW